VIALLVNFQLSAGIAMLTVLKPRFCYKYIFINFFMFSNVTYILYILNLDVHGKGILG